MEIKKGSIPEVVKTFPPYIQNLIEAKKNEPSYTLDEFLLLRSFSNSPDSNLIGIVYEQFSEHSPKLGDFNSKASLYATLIGTELGLSEELISNMQVTMLLHGIVTDDALDQLDDDSKRIVRGNQFMNGGIYNPSIEITHWYKNAAIPEDLSEDVIRAIIVMAYAQNLAELPNLSRRFGDYYPERDGGYYTKEQAVERMFNERIGSANNQIEQAMHVAIPQWLAESSVSKSQKSDNPV